MEIKIKDITQVSAEGDIDGEDTVKHPLEYILLSFYEKIEGFLKEKAETIVPQKINPLPHIEDGIITGASASSTYFLENCRVENIWDPMPLGPFHANKGHAIRIAGSSSEVDKASDLIEEVDSFFIFKYAKKEKTYQTSRDLDLRAFSSVSDLEKELSIPEAIRNPNNLFEQLKDIKIAGERLSGEPEILHEIEDYLRGSKEIPIVREQIKRILEYVPGVFPENWKSPESFDKLSEPEKKAYSDIAKKGLSQIPGPLIQKVIELGLEYKKRKQISKIKL